MTDYLKIIFQEKLLFNLKYILILWVAVKGHETDISICLMVHLLCSAVSNLTITILTLLQSKCPNTLTYYTTFY